MHKMDHSAIIMDPDEEKEEIKSVTEIVKAFKLYRLCSYMHLNKTEKYLDSLPLEDQNMLIEYRKHLGAVRDCFDKNQIVIDLMLQERILSSVLGDRLLQPLQKIDWQKDIKVRRQDTEKMKTTLKLIARDWSETCKEEREQSYKPIIEAIKEYYPPDQYALNEIKILVPGAGLGRLTYELACLGYECEGNEFSYFMLITSYFLLNECTEPNTYTLHPWAHHFVNNLNANDQITSIKFPDVCPIQNPPKGNMAMAAGDFLQVYKTPDLYDCVATCFFIDCANNIVDFIRTIYSILVPGGLWVNLGPLLYHYSDVQGENSIEPSYDQLLPIIEMIGFKIRKTKTGLRTKYSQNPRSMVKNEYESVFWVCQKPHLPNENEQEPK